MAANIATSSLLPSGPSSNAGPSNAAASDVIAVSSDHFFPAPTMSRKRRPSHIEKSVTWPDGIRLLKIAWWDGFKADKQSLSQKAFGLDFANDPIPNLRSGRGVDVHLSFLRLGRSGRRWVYHRDVALFFFRRRIRHGRFLLLTSREQRNASEQTNILSHVSESNLRMNLVVFKKSPLIPRISPF